MIDGVHLQVVHFASGHTSGDLVVYLRDADVYHVALLEAQNQVVSSTVNAARS